MAIGTLVDLIVHKASHVRVLIVGSKHAEAVLLEQKFLR